MTWEARLEAEVAFPAWDTDAPGWSFEPIPGCGRRNAGLERRPSPKKWPLKWKLGLQESPAFAQAAGRRGPLSLAPDERWKPSNMHLYSQDFPSVVQDFEFIMSM